MGKQTAQIQISIGRMAFRIECAQQDFLKRLGVKYHGFLSPGSKGKKYRIILLPKPEANPEQEITLERDNGHYLLLGDGFRAVYELKKKQVVVRLRLEESFFDRFLRVFVSLIALSENGFLIHGAGIASPGRAYLFAGPSSSGKTTVVRMAKGFHILNDELTLVRKIGREICLFATPFVGEFAGPVKDFTAPLKNVFFLQKNLSTPYRKQDTMGVILNLLTSVFCFVRDQESSQQILGLCHQLSHQVAGYDVNVLSWPGLKGGIDAIKADED
jgi:hypothetical protein